MMCTIHDYHTFRTVCPLECSIVSNKQNVKGRACDMVYQNTYKCTRASVTASECVRVFEVNIWAWWKWETGIRVRARKHVCMFACTCTCVCEHVCTAFSPSFSGEEFLGKLHACPAPASYRIQIPEHRYHNGRKHPSTWFTFTLYSARAPASFVIISGWLTPPRSSLCGVSEIQTVKVRRAVWAPPGCAPWSRAPMQKWLSETSSWKKCDRTSSSSNIKHRLLVWRVCFRRHSRQQANTQNDLLATVESSGPWKKNQTYFRPVHVLETLKIAWKKFLMELRLLLSRWGGDTLQCPHLWVRWLYWGASLSLSCCNSS